ncbi:MAG: hypothetical protein EZS26_001917 [Candidatus Ordinivivax streblomastigis]|uniref:SusD/RagB family nutrient-binding outer membrane lipoprotein n=1 Tax=Candidatus Ordinivivax streblomastigis TaxID=2540710 RepID=A0A5M8P0I8_9BACT|nr:MAG: hypothetical protein EZS26_001917 [Candidatus Ordinivivax streblomastigis]
MKRNVLYIILSVFALLSNGCTDHFEEINKDPNKLYDVDFNYVFPGTVYRSMNNLGELNFNYLMTYSRYTVIQAFCGPREEEGDGFYNRFYVQILRDLEKADKEYASKKGYENRLAIIKTWKAYTYYIMVSMYGSIAMSDAMLTDENKTEYKYDTEEKAYLQILQLLDEAVDLYNPQTAYSADALNPDPVFGAKGNTTRWRKFANTMRLNIALHIQNLAPETAETYVKKAMEHEDWLISANDENVAPKWGSNINSDVSFYYNRLLKGIEAQPSEFNQTLYPGMGEYFAIYLFTFNDPRKEEYFDATNANAISSIEKPFLFADTITRPHICARTGTDKCANYTEHQADGLNDQRRDSIIAQYTVPYVPLSELPFMAFNWEAEYVSSTSTERLSDPITSLASKYNPSYMKKRFLDKEASLPILSYTEACFMKAEAKILYGAGSQSAEQYYNEGINASFAQYNITAKAADYIKQNGIKWNTSQTGFSDRRGLYTARINGEGSDKNHLEQIYKQRYFAGYLNFLEAWNMERRTRVMAFPPFFASGVSNGVEGANSTYNYSMERFIYPKTEMSQNNTQYRLAIENLRAVSPFFREDRWGDNIFTSLGIAKLNLDLTTAEAKYVGNKRIKYCAEYFIHTYGTTYEEMLVKAKAMTGETNDTKALTKAFNFKFGNLIGTYIPE